MKDLDERLKDYLSGLAQAGLRRTLRAAEPLSAGRVRVGGRELVNFCSNDYLGLSHHPAVIARAREWAKRFGAGSGASRLVSGNIAAFEAIEGKLAALKGTQAALVLASGFQANASLLPALLDKALWEAEPVVLADRLIHASLHTGIRAAGARAHRYRHNDLGHLEALLSEAAGRGQPAVIVTESVFSMDGDITDVEALAALARRYEALVYIDEAHATGVLGPGGAGLSVGQGFDVVMGTFGKALGAFGAYAAGSAPLMDFLVNRCAGLVYATALPPAVLGAVDAALDLLPGLEDERRRLQTNARRVREAFQAAGLNTGASATQIVPVILGNAERAVAVARCLEEEHGILAVAIRPPTVPPGTARIRFALSAAHSDADVERLVAAVPRAVEAAGR